MYPASGRPCSSFLGTKPAPDSRPRLVGSNGRSVSPLGRGQQPGSVSRNPTTAKLQPAPGAGGSSRFGPGLHRNLSGPRSGTPLGGPPKAGFSLTNRGPPPGPSLARPPPFAAPRPLSPGLARPLSQARPPVFALRRSSSPIRTLPTPAPTPTRPLSALSRPVHNLRSAPTLSHVPTASRGLSPAPGPTTAPRQSGAIPLTGGRAPSPALIRPVPRKAPGFVTPASRAPTPPPPRALSGRRGLSPAPVGPTLAQPQAAGGWPAPVRPLPTGGPGQQTGMVQRLGRTVLAVDDEFK